MFDGGHDQGQTVKVVKSPSECFENSNADDKDIKTEEAKSLKDVLNSGQMIPEKLIHKKDSEIFLYRSEFSPFHIAYPAPFTVDGHTFSNAGHYIQYRIAKMFNDQIQKPTDPKKIQHCKIKKLDTEEWHDQADEIILDAVVHKFNQNEKLKELLLSTGDLYLAQAKSEFWGTAVGFSHKNAMNMEAWKGENKSGEALMKARDTLRRRQQEQDQRIQVSERKYKDEKMAILKSLSEDDGNNTNGRDINEGRVKSLDPLADFMAKNPGQEVPEELIHKKNSEMFLFCSHYSPFHERFPAPFTADGHSFINAEQYISYHKALLFKDQTRSQKILQAKNPQKIKTLQLDIENFDAHEWHYHSEKILKEAMVHKFSQNEILKELMLNTGDLYIAGATRSEFWGTGVRLYEQKALNREAWTGWNMGGRALMKARHILRQQQEGQQQQHEQQLQQEQHHWRVKASHPLEFFMAKNPGQAIPEELIHRKNSETFLYASHWSPFNDSYPAPFTADGNEFINAHQYICYQIAKLLNDQATCQKILQSTLPQEMYNFQLRNRDPKKWRRHIENVTQDAMVYKFSQNEKLKEQLLNTGDLYLAHVSSKFWGTGVRLYAKNPFNRNKWTGRNKHGKALMRARDIIRQQQQPLLSLPSPATPPAQPQEGQQHQQSQKIKESLSEGNCTVSTKENGMSVVTVKTRYPLKEFIAKNPGQMVPDESTHKKNWEVLLYFTQHNPFH